MDNVDLDAGPAFVINGSLTLWLELPDGGGGRHLWRAFSPGHLDFGGDRYERYHARLPLRSLWRPVFRWGESPDNKQHELNLRPE